MTKEKNLKLRELPAVGIVLGWPGMKEIIDLHGRMAARWAIQQVIARMREAMEQGSRVHPDPLYVVSAVRNEIERAGRPSLLPVINATGILVHTNLGRAPLAQEAARAVADIAVGYSNLEYDLEQGERGSRLTHIGGLLVEITGAEAGIAVNNNAAAVLLALNTLAEGRDVVVSRGELVEIGGSFRIPEIINKSGCRLVEVGTTNKTHLYDYRDAATGNTAVFLKIHKSNFRMEGFVEEVPAKELVELGRQTGVRVVEDLGSGSLIAGEELGMPHEPTVQESVGSGCDLVTFSGDKLLGGPQAGIIVGKKNAVEACRKNHLARALRLDKMTMAALEATLRIYRDPVRAKEKIPILRAASMPPADVERRARDLARRLSEFLNDAASIEVRPTQAQVGGGALPLTALESFAVAVRPGAMSLKVLEKALRHNDPPIIARVADEAVLLDLRTILDGQERVVENALKQILKGG